jgi:hypothetical protein
MKIVYQQMQERIIKPLQQWIRKIMNNRDDDDNSFNHPWAIL